MRCCVIKAWPENVMVGQGNRNLAQAAESDKGIFMKSKVLKLDARKFVWSSATLAVFTIAALWSTASHAQVYRIVGPDGKVTFSDKPPVTESTPRVGAATSSSAGGGGSTALPYELRQVAAKYPVTLYVGENCGPCGAGRSMLTSRGIPFAEKTVSSSGDAQALQRLSGDTSLPFMTIGSQQLKGFSDSEWTQFLDAAGYPATSILPASYRRPAATPLVAAAPAPAVAATAAPAVRPPPAPASPPAQTNENPAGIKF
jgi:glutaredoxin